MNILPYLIINNVNSQTIQGLIISELAPISKPQQRTRIEEIDGRDGDLVTPLGFAAYDKTVKIGLSYGYDIDEIIEFFNSSGVVTFSNEPDKYYRFAIYQQIDFERLIRFKTAEVVFHCQPFKFSTTEEPLLFDVSSGSPITVTNEGNTDSRPNILVLGNDNIDLSLNGSQILSIDLGDEEQAVIIDTEDMNAYGAQSAIKEVIAEINPIQEGSGDPSPDNRRPITGITAANITRVGKNIWGGLTMANSFSGCVGYTLDTENKTFTFRRSYTLTNLPKFKENTRYTILLKATAVDLNNSLRIFYTDESFTNLYIPQTIEKTMFVFTSAANKTISYIRLAYNSIGEVTVYYDESGMFEGVMTAEDFESYLGEVYNIPFVDDQGDPIIAYKGHINFTTGVLTLGGQIVDLGSLNWTHDSTNQRFYTSSALSGAANNKPLLCDIYKYVGSFASLVDKSCANIYNNRVGIKDLSYTDAATFKSAMSDHTLLYELATPIEIQLTPTQITNLLGSNQLYTDTNGEIEITFSSNGVIQTQTGDIVSFDVGAEDMTKGILLNRLITGDYDKIRLNKGDNTLTLTGGAQQLVIDKYSRWL